MANASGSVNAKQLNVEQSEGQLSQTARREGQSG